VKLAYTKEVLANKLLINKESKDELIILKNGHRINLDEAVEDLNMLPKLVKMLSSVSEALMPPLDKEGFKRAVNEQKELFEWFDKNKITYR
jgi:hypothetical protein